MSSLQLGWCVGNLRCTFLSTPWTKKQTWSFCGCEKEQWSVPYVPYGERMKRLGCRKRQRERAVLWLEGSFDQFYTTVRWIHGPKHNLHSSISSVRHHVTNPLCTPRWYAVELATSMPHLKLWLREHISAKACHYGGLFTTCWTHTVMITHLIRDSHHSGSDTYLNFILIK